MWPDHPNGCLNQAPQIPPPPPPAPPPNPTCARWFLEQIKVLAEAQNRPDIVQKADKCLNDRDHGQHNTTSDDDKYVDVKDVFAALQGANPNYSAIINELD